MGTAVQAAAGTTLAPIPVAFVGRTSTLTMQDPVESLTRQIRRAKERMPDGLFISRYYWDVESGGTDLDRRSQTGTWRKFADAGIPRDGGMADLRAAVAAGQPPFSAVICENIERSGRDMFDALKLEKELRAAGMVVFATDEPIDLQAPESSTILMRRMKQGMAEYFRYNVKAQLWEGLRQYALSGFNTGRCPYGYAEDRTPHPNPMKASMGATRARLVPDPERGPWVTRMFQWRVWEKMSVPGVARRLTREQAPSPSGDGQPWSAGTVAKILRNPKYTGRIVLGRTHNAGAGRRPGERKERGAPRDQWTWAEAGNAHPALVPFEMWEAAQSIGAERGSVRDHDAPGAGHRDYPLRARLFCVMCKRRMAGKSYPRKKGAPYTYYVCPHNPKDPRHAAAHPAHGRAAIKETVINDALERIFDDHLLGHDRAAMLTATIPASQAEQDTRTAERAQQLRQQITRAETAINGLMAQMEHLGADTSPAAQAQRDRITTQFSHRYDEQKHAQTELDTLTASQPAAPDPTLLDELPYLPGILNDAPDDLAAALYAAFDVAVSYRHDKQQATIRATITDATPAIIRALITDPRTTDPRPTTASIGNSAPVAIRAERPWI
jgi:site-specific DNA recombinase